MSKNSHLNLASIPLLIGYISDGGGWTITEILPSGRVDYTPKAFEAEYGYLPPLGRFKDRFLQRRKKEYYAHRKQNPASERGKGFGGRK